MNWLDLLTQFDWQKIATGAIGLFVLWYERKWLKDSAVGAGKKVAGVFKKAKATKDIEEPDNRAELAAALHLIADAIAGMPECDKAVETLAKKLVWRWEAEDAPRD